MINELQKTEKFGKVEIWNEIEDLYSSEKQMTIKKIQTLLKMDMKIIEEKTNYDNPINGHFKINGRIGNYLTVILTIELHQNCLCSIPLLTLLKTINVSLEAINIFIPKYNKVTKKDVKLQNSENDFIQEISFRFRI